MLVPRLGQGQSLTKPMNRTGMVGQGILNIPEPMKRQNVLDAFMNPTNAGNDALLALGAGLLSQNRLQDGIAAGLQGWNESWRNSEQTAGAQADRDLRVQQANFDNQMATQNQELAQNQDQRAAADAARAAEQAPIELEKLKQDLAKGNLIDLGNGWFRNLETGENIQPPPEMVKQVLDFTRAKANAGNIRNPAFSQRGDLYVSPSGDYFTEIFDPNTGGSSFQNNSSGQRVNALPDGSFRAQDSGVKYQTKAGAEDETSLLDNAAAATGNIASLQAMKANAQGQTGGALWDTAGRWLAENLGTQIGSYDPTRIAEVQQKLSQMELDAAAQMKGQGQITESERAILRKSIPNMATSPEAFNAVTDIFIRANQRAIDEADAWSNATPEERAKGIKLWRYGRNTKKAQPSNDAVLQSADDIVGLTSKPNPKTPGK